MYVSQTSRAGVPLWIASCTRWQESSPNKPREGLKQLSQGCRDSCGASLCRRSPENPQGRWTPAHPRHRPALAPLAQRPGAEPATHQLQGEEKGRGSKFCKEAEAGSQREKPTHLPGAVRCGAVQRMLAGLSATGRPSRPRGTRCARCLCGAGARAAVFVPSAPHMV